MSKFSSPFMAKSPLRDTGSIHVGNPNYKGPKEIGAKWLKDHEEVAKDIADGINSGRDEDFDNAINTVVTLSEGGKARVGNSSINVPSFTTTGYDLAKQSGFLKD